MKICLFLLFLVASNVVALNKPFPVEEEDDEDFVDEEFDETIYSRAKRFAGGAENTDLSKLPFIAMIYYLKPAFTEISTGVVLNKYWVLTTVYNILENTLVQNKMKVKVASFDPAKSTATDIVRSVKEVVYDDVNYQPSFKYVKCLAVLRVCPSFPASAYQITLAPALTPYYDATKKVNMYNYVRKVNPGAADPILPLHKATKNIGEKCECDEMSGFDGHQHLCIGSNPNIYVYTSNPDEREDGVIIMNESNSEVIGFIVNAVTGGPEMMIWAKYYSEWITTNTPVAPYD